MSENVVAPGWYPDPLGLPQQRWWNGSGWTEQVNAPQPPGAPTTVAYAEPEPDVIVIDVVERSAAAAPAAPPPHRGAHIADPRLALEAPSDPVPAGGAHVAAPRLEIEPPASQGGAHVAPPRLEIDPPVARASFPAPAAGPTMPAPGPTPPPSVSFEALFGAPPPSASARVVPDRPTLPPDGLLDGLPAPRRDQRYPLA